jgi:predicted aspartyl protease
MPAYDVGFHPPAPFLDVRVFNPVDSSKVVSRRGKLDTGADFCAIPDALIDLLELLPEDTVITRGYNHETKVCDVFRVSLEVAGQQFENIAVIATPREDVLIGRDVLNHFVITLNGKDLTFDMKDP